MEGQDFLAMDPLDDLLMCIWRMRGGAADKKKPTVRDSSCFVSAATVYVTPPATSGRRAQASLEPFGFLEGRPIHHRGLQGL